MDTRYFNRHEPTIWYPHDGWWWTDDWQLEDTHTKFEPIEDEE